MMDLFGMYEKYKLAIRKKVLDERIRLCEYRGWTITLPYPNMFFTGFRIFNEEKDYSVIVGEAIDRYPDRVLLECSCCFSRFDSLDEIIDHIENDECYKPE